jgi:hypothetical protein
MAKQPVSFAPQVSFAISGSGPTSRGVSQAIAESWGQALVYQCRYDSTIAFVLRGGKQVYAVDENSQNTFDSLLLQFGIRLIVRGINPGVAVRHHNAVDDRCAVVSSTQRWTSGRIRIKNCGFELEPCGDAEVSTRKPCKIGVKQTRRQETWSGSRFPDLDFRMGFLTPFES